MIKKLIFAAAINLVSMNALFAYDAVDCSTNPIFGQYGCNECFNGGEVKNGDNLSFLDDLWKNGTSSDRLMYKEEIVYPKMNSVNGATFTQKPSSDSEFWETTSDLENLYSSTFDGYVVPAGQSVTWLRSTLGSAYNYQNQALSVGATAGVLVFDIMSHEVGANNEIQMSDKPHRECVAYVNASPVGTPEPTPEPTPTPTPQEMTQVQTGPAEYLIVLMLSLLLGVAFVNRKLVLEKIKK